MGIKSYRPRTAAMRWRTVSDFAEITKKRPEKSLVVTLKNSGGRNSNGRITSRHRGGGHKRKLRIIDFFRDKQDMPARVIAIEYDPNRSARIALLQYSDGEKRYIVSPLGLSVGDEIMSSDAAEIKIGNCMSLRNIPPGIPIYNLEIKRGKGGQVARSAGNSCIIMSKEGEYAHVRMPSGEIRLVHCGCRATIGQVGNVERDALTIGRAGTSRHMNRRPFSRGVVKNPVDHPMGGGEGKSSGGRHPCSPWGQAAKGLKTRHRKSSDKLIVKRRK